MLRAGYTANRPCRGLFGDHFPGKRNGRVRLAAHAVFGVAMGMFQGSPATLTADVPGAIVTIDRGRS